MVTFDAIRFDFDAIRFGFDAIKKHLRDEVAAQYGGYRSSGLGINFKS